MTHLHSHPAPAPVRAARVVIPGRLRALWSGFVGAIGALVGLAPHVLHHVGVLAGTALVAGAGGTVLFGVLGLVASVPMLWRLRRRFNSWWAPSIALVVFAAMFALSTFVVGPLISGGEDASSGGGEGPAPAPTDHTGHHGS
ncbi:hypothetical protein V6U81_20725 [Micromonospora sp. CPCC 205711]|uniref:hypothetical protein n=1 Tax=Micromonospora sp. CPCC 205547 TaxID=3122400 RepID=UPI002FF04334